jgi:hypothetical protein
MLPSRDAAFLACGALILDCAGLAGVRPVAAHLLLVLLDFAPDVIGLGNVTQMPACSRARSRF